MLLALIALTIVPQAQAGTGFIKSLAAAEKEAKAKKQMIFVDMFAQWCGWCHRFDKEVVPSEVFQKATQNMVLLRLDTEDAAEGTRFAQKYKISSLPTFLILNSDLSLAAVIRGYAPAQQFVQMLNGALEKDLAFKKLVGSEKLLQKEYAKRLEIAGQFRERQAFGESETRLKKLVAEKNVPVEFRDKAFLELATLYMQQNLFEKVFSTVAEFAKVQSKGESLERAKLMISEVYLAQGNMKYAMRELRSFKKSYPNSKMASEVANLLLSLERQYPQQ